MDLGKSQAVKQQRKKLHIPSTVQADTLFNFMTELEYLTNILKLKMVSPRYCIEDVRYLKLKGVKKLAFPMRCFCDINLHRLKEHLYWYGYYGIAFSKEWGMRAGIQPLQYVNEDSYLRKDYSLAFKSATKTKVVSNDIKQMKSYLIYQLMYLKPYSGVFQRRVNEGEKQKNTIKCFADECEWRFVPDVTSIGYRQIYYKFADVNSFTFNEINKSLEGNKKVSLAFEYSDIKYLIVKTREDFQSLLLEIEGILSIEEQKELISKIIIWDESEGDF